MSERNIQSLIVGLTAAQNARANALERGAISDKTISMLEDDLITAKRKLNESEDEKNKAEEKIKRLEMEIRELRLNEYNESAEVKNLNNKVKKLQEDLHEANNVKNEKSDLLKEWMLSNEAFKRLARKYGNKMNLSKEDIDKDFREEVLDVVEEKPEYENTQLNQRIKERDTNKVNKL